MLPVLKVYQRILPFNYKLIVMNKWRELTPEEIFQLETQNCKAESWNQVKVSLDFSTGNIKDTTFSGEVFLGRFGKKMLLSGIVPVESGIYNAHIHHCKIEDDVYINRINRFLANYCVGEGSIIENVDCIFTEGESRFGNGTVISVLDETGGRPVIMYEGLSAHTAYLMAMSVHRTRLIDALNKIALNYAKSVKSTMGQIGKGCCIRNTGTIRNVKVCDGCEIEGASILDDGCLCASPSAFTGEDSDLLMTFAYAGSGVIARHFILAPGAVVKDGVQIERCFVGEAAELSHGFSAHDSLFFANAQMENGESCASFLGPYTVSMHKSTLMVSGMFSFCNLGSGTNQSNHFYKLGPMHSGIMERGCKTGSDTYILWPGKIGPFSFIKDRHAGNPDTRKLPFSFLFEDNGKSYITPGTTLRSIGTLRDELKWPQRDKRTSLTPIDKICFEVLNPHTIAAIYSGLEILDGFLVDGQAPEYSYNGVSIKKSFVVRGRKLYKKALQVYIGSALNKMLEHLEADGTMNGNILKTLLSSSLSPVSDSWTDLAGLLVPDSELSVLLAALEKGDVQSVVALEEEWNRFFRNYEKWSWQNALQYLAKQKAKAIHELQLTDFMDILDEWEESQQGFYKQMLADASLEMTMMQRFAPRDKKFTHPFMDVLKISLEELPTKVAHWKDLLQSEISFSG